MVGHSYDLRKGIIIIIFNVCTILWFYTHTWPLSSIWLLVNFSLSNETTCFNHCPPDAGESGWICTLGGDIGSDFPATTQLELYNLI